ncbi:MAG: hypothetical protein AB7L91_06915 [Dehalococcoidia bacterium]
MSTDGPTDGGMDVGIGGDNSGNVVSVGAGGAAGDIAGTIVHGDVVVIQMPAPLGTLLQQAPTNAPPGAPGSGLETPPVDREQAEIVRQALAGVRAAEASGRPVEAVQAGDIRVSKVELLLKRGGVLKAEAAQMMAENATKKQPELQALQMRFRSAQAFDTGAMAALQAEQEAIVWRDFDRQAFTAKLAEARALFEEALSIEDTNTEALLQLAELLMALTPDDVSDEERVLTKAHALLGHAATDDDRFKQAQALMLSVQSLVLKHQRTPPGPELAGAVQTCLATLTEARDQFRRLNRTLWATMADQMLQQLQAASAVAWGSPAAASPAQPPRAFGGQAGAWGAPTAQAGQGATHAFQPPGQWSVNVSVGGMPTESAYVAMGYDQSMQAVVSPSGVTIQGRWDFIPATGTLMLQGVANGVIPYALQLQILQAGPAGAIATDGRGSMYQFVRTG